MLVGAVYGLRWSPFAAIASVIAGEAVLLGLTIGLIPESVQGGFLPLIPALVVACMILGVDYIITRSVSSAEI
jgi:SSS family solute:Na+ symporter